MAKLLTGQEQGVFAISVTPMENDGSICEDNIPALVNFYIDAGVSGITILGMMGEAQKLLPEESRLMIDRVLSAVDGRVPVVVGVSAAGFAPLHALAVYAMQAGAAGVMVAPPSTLKHDAAVYDYYRAVADLLGPDIPIVVQDFPLSTGVEIPVSVLGRLIADCPSIVMLKHEAWPGLTKLQATRQLEHDGGRHISILTGNGGLFLPQEMARGADGAMTGFAYPEMLVGVVENASAGRREAAEALFDAFLPLVRYEQQPGVGLSVRKEVLFRRGVLKTPALRRPFYRLNKADHADLDGMIVQLRHRLPAIDAAIAARVFSSASA
ncbi:dihydrodipicolinate synthase family protein [Komagataeibacter xylinus]|uniref:dihydrodipicolinate synthase family protein n=1 Tax=Komagataeibacter xylinus TaxID=28448 RepID=UPI001F0FCD77|nr:dihydrodipicolinate synthase family protein [Komagataeibacter xylinus]